MLLAPAADARVAFSNPRRPFGCACERELYSKREDVIGSVIQKLVVKNYKIAATNVGDKIEVVVVVVVGGVWRMGLRRRRCAVMADAGRTRSKRHVTVMER